MNILQLRCACEVASNKFNISTAAHTLSMAQPSVSRHIQALERELGVHIFVRSKRRLLGLTKMGEGAIELAKKLVRVAEDIRRMSDDYRDVTGGQLTIAASHTSARYLLPPVVQKYTRLRPGVQLVMLQGSPTEIRDWIVSRESDIAIVPSPPLPLDGIAYVACHKHDRIVLTTPKHPLLSGKITLEKLARYPLITHDRESGAYKLVLKAFRAKGLEPNVVMHATDVDVMKTYVKSGLGVAIVPKVAYITKEDSALRCIDARHLFESNTIYLAFHKGHYVRTHVLEFLRLFAPNLRRLQIEKAIFEP